MTAAPLPRQADLNPKLTPVETTPVLALKELVANLHREQNKIQNLLSSLGFALRSFNNLNQFLELTPLMAARVTDGDGGALVLFSPSGEVCLEHLHSHNPQVSQIVRRAIEATLKELALHRSVPRAAAGSASRIAGLDESLRQQLASKIEVFGTPILVKNVERGRLYVFSANEDYVWTQTRRKLAQLVADQTAVAIANHELTVELRAKERQDRELEIASEIQLRLLPRKCPHIEGVELAARCQTANRVGGDYYDFIPTNFDQLRHSETGKGEAQARVPWSIAIGDVMGKGVPAGLIMTMTRGMLRAEVLNRHTPAQILRHLNRVMYADLENSHRFVTLFYSEYDPKTRLLCYSNAAHNPPLLWRAASGTIGRLDTWGMLVGLDADSEYEDAQVQLFPGDRLVYYTDGFTDAVNAKGDRFDEENLARVFAQSCAARASCQGILDALFAEVECFTGGENSHSDDRTLIVMEIKDRED
ncbi:MAG: SpoIIE family protein phosphatase [Chloroflexaceae bacterium]|nr:SpoIIE family protein phosphatase [Chloroflexaceae bacterium]